MAEKKKFETRRLFILNNPNAPRLSPELAAEIGLNESVLFLQLEFWIAIYGQGKESPWISRSYSEILETFPFWSLSTIRRAIKSLEELDLISVEINSGKSLRFTLNLDRVSQLRSLKLLSVSGTEISADPVHFEQGEVVLDPYQNEQGTPTKMNRVYVQNEQGTPTKMNRPIKEKREIKREILESNRDIKPKLDPMYELFANSFAEHYGSPYRDKPTELQDIVKLKRLLGNSLTVESWSVAVANYFLSDITSHSLKDLALRYETFHKHALDKFKQPKRTANGIFSSVTEGNIRAAREAMEIFNGKN